MLMLARLISLAALAVTIVPCLLYFARVIDHGSVRMLALSGTIAWFAVTPLWMGRTLPIDADEVEI